MEVLLMTDEYNVARYLPKKAQEKISEITMDLDFDNIKNRNVYHYTVWFKSGNAVSAVGIPGIKQAVKTYLNMC